MRRLGDCLEGQGRTSKEAKTSVLSHEEAGVFCGLSTVRRGAACWGQFAGMTAAAGDTLSLRCLLDIQVDFKQATNEALLYSRKRSWLEARELAVVGIMLCSCRFVV